MSETADVLVIGGGIAGIGAAARLAPDANVIVLEQEEAIGYHSTGRSAAIFIRNYGNTTIRALNRFSEPVMCEPEGIADSSLLSPRGELLVAREEDIPAFEAYIAGSDGMEELSPGEAAALVPILRPERISRAVIERDARDIDVDRLLQGFARMLRAHGGKIVTRAEAKVVARTGGVWKIRTNAGEFEAPVVINAAGAWADVIARRADVPPVGLQPKRRSAVIIPAPDGHDVSHWPLFGSAAENWYAKPEAGKLMISPADEDPVDPHDAWPDDMVLAEGISRFEESTTVTVTRVERSWAGLRCFVADRTPVAGFAPDTEGFFWLAGQGGYGVQTSPALSQLAADLVLGRPAPLAPEVVAALSPARAGLFIQKEATP